MNFQFYLEKLQNSKALKDFLKESPKAFMCSGFFTIDFEGQDSLRHIDFYNPKTKEVISFNIQSQDIKNKDGVAKVPSQNKFGTNIQQNFLTPKEISDDFDFDFKRIEDIVRKEVEKRDVNKKLQKIMISLQDVGGKPLLVCTVFVSMFGLLSVHIDPAEDKVVKFEKKSFLDFMKKVK